MRRALILKWWILMAFYQLAFGSELGRRGGGGMSTEGVFTIESGNRAGNSEDDEESDLGGAAVPISAPVARLTKTLDGAKELQDLGDSDAGIDDAVQKAEAASAAFTARQATKAWKDSQRAEKKEDCGGGTPDFLPEPNLQQKRFCTLLPGKNPACPGTINSKGYYARLKRCPMTTACGQNTTIWKKGDFEPVYFNETSDDLDCPIGDDPAQWFTSVKVKVDGLAEASQPRVICAKVPGVDISFKLLPGKLGEDRTALITEASYAHNKQTRTIPRFSFVTYGLLNNYRGLPCTVAAMVGDAGVPEQDPLRASQIVAADKLFAGALTTQLHGFSGMPVGGVVKADVCYSADKKKRIRMDRTFTLDKCVDTPRRGRRRRRGQVQFQINPGSFWQQKAQESTQKAYQKKKSRKGKSRKEKVENLGEAVQQRRKKRLEKPMKNYTLDPAELDGKTRPMNAPWAIFNGSSQARFWSDVDQDARENRLPLYHGQMILPKLSRQPKGGRCEVCQARKQPCLHVKTGECLKKLEPRNIGTEDKEQWVTDCPGGSIACGDPCCDSACCAPGARRCKFRRRKRKSRKGKCREGKSREGKSRKGKSRKGKLENLGEAVQQQRRRRRRRKRRTRRKRRRLEKHPEFPWPHHI